MATSYPDRTNARGIWRLSDITRNIKTEGTFPNASGRALFLGGHTGSASNVIDFIDLALYLFLSNTKILHFDVISFQPTHL